MDRHPSPLTSEERKGDTVVVWMRGVPRAVLAMVDEGMWGGARLEVKGPTDCCCCCVTAASSGELDVTGRALPGGKNAPRPIMPPRLSPSEDDIPMAPISIPPPAEEDTPPIQDGKAPPPNASSEGTAVVGSGMSDPSISWGR